MEKQKVVIGWADNGTVHGIFTESLLALQKFEQNTPSDEYVLIDIIRESGLYTEHNRNQVVKFARTLNADWLLQLDGDESFPPDLLRKIMRTAHPETRPIIAGIYANVGNFGRDGEGSFNIVDCLYSEGPDGRYRIVTPTTVAPFEVDAAGTGVMLTHMNVFRKMEYPWFWLEHMLVNSQPELMNEDIAFCRKARNLGYHIWCDPLAEATHWKTVPLVSSNFRKFLIRSAEIKEGFQKES